MSEALIAIITPLFDAGDDPSDRRGSIRLAVGALLVVAAIGRWRTRPRPEDDPPTPPFLGAIDGAGTAGVLGIGFALAAFNPKDMLLAAAGGAEIGSAELSGGSTLVALLLFTSVAASTAVVPVGAHLIVGDRLDDRLQRSREWLVRHNPTVMAVVLLALGALFIAEGIHILRS